MDVEFSTVICMKEDLYLWWLGALPMEMERTRVNIWTSLYQDLNGNYVVSSSNSHTANCLVEV